MRMKNILDKFDDFDVFVLYNSLIHSFIQSFIDSLLTFVNFNFEN